MRLCFMNYFETYFFSVYKPGINQVKQLLLISDSESSRWCRFPSCRIGVSA